MRIITIVTNKNSDEKVCNSNGNSLSEFGSDKIFEKGKFIKVRGNLSTSTPVGDAHSSHPPTQVDYRQKSQYQHKKFCVRQCSEVALQADA